MATNIPYSTPIFIPPSLLYLIQCPPVALFLVCLWLIHPDPLGTPLKFIKYTDNGSLNSTTAVEDSQLYWDNLDIHEELELENDDDPTALDPARRVEWTRGELFIWLDMCFQFSRKIKETFLLPGDEQGPEIESFVEKALSLGVPPQIDEVMDVIVAGDRVSISVISPYRPALIGYCRA